ncbi:TrkH family potassium uptake protein [Halovenus marina]|uniref:TrkH family potassium uptake protein n=1 Tax=Halovenus marina TaxID=3396621 RepID=UPI003F547638
MLRLRVRWRASVDLTGRILLYLAVPLSFPLLIAAYAGESLLPFLVTIAVTLSVGSGMRYITDPDLDIGPREGFLAVALIWLLVAVIGAIPFLVAGTGTIGSPVNALFESMSGLTTTGATVLRDFEIHAQSILMWRQLLQWLGGLGILILATAVLSSLGVAGAQLMETETQTENVNRLTPKISHTARLIWGLYLGLTGLAIAVYWGLGLSGLAPNMDLYNAVAHAFTSVSTAGFSSEPLSLGAFDPVVQWAAIPFMIVGSTSFTLLYYAIHGEPGRLLRNEEFHFYLGAIAAFTLVVGTALVYDPNTTFGGTGTVRHALFNVVSIITTTGYASADFATWSPAAKHMLWLGMFIGGMVGSTTCSVKSLRWLVTLKSLRRDLFTSIHPNAIRPVRVSGKPIDEQTVKDIYSFVLLSVLIVVLLTVFIVINAERGGDSVPEFDALGAASSTFLNIGPAFGDAGPYGTYEGFQPSTKAVMFVLMWIGRIEIIPVLVLFTKSFWTS